MNDAFMCTVLWCDDTMMKGFTNEVSGENASLVFCFLFLIITISLCPFNHLRNTFHYTVSLTEWVKWTWRPLHLKFLQTDRFEVMFNLMQSNQIKKERKKLDETKRDRYVHKNLPVLFYFDRSFRKCSIIFFLTFCL